MQLGGVGLCVALLLVPALSLKPRIPATGRVIEFAPLPELSNESLSSPEYEASPADGYYLLPRSFIDGVLPGPLPYGQLSKLLVHVQLVVHGICSPPIYSRYHYRVHYVSCVWQQLYW